MRKRPGIGKFIFQLGLSISIFCCFANADLSRRSPDAGLGRRPEEQTLQDFVLKEYLDHDWSRELVFFPLSKKAAATKPKKLTLSGPDDKEVPFQIIAPTQPLTPNTQHPTLNPETRHAEGRSAAAENPKPHIAFLIDLPARTEQIYKLIERAPAKRPAIDLEFAEKEDSLRLWNSLTGLEVPGSGGSFSNGPIASIRLRSGKWVGGSRLVTERKIVSYKATVLAHGPVFGEIECKYAFEGDKTWTIRFRVIAGEPVIVLSERFDLEDKSRWELLLHPGFFPNHMAFRNCYDPQGTRLMDSSDAVRLSFEKPATPFVLHAWLPWSNPANVSFLGLFRAGKGIRYIHDKKAGGPVRIAMPGEPSGSAIHEEVGKAAGTEVDLSERLALDEDDTKTAVAEDILFAAAGHGGIWARPGQNGQEKAVPLKTTPDAQVYFSLQLAGPAREWILGASTVEKSVVPDMELAEPQLFMIKYCETPLQEVLDMTLEWEPPDKPEDYPRLYPHEEEISTDRKPSNGVAPPPTIGNLLPSVRIFTEAGVNNSGRPRPSQTAYTHGITRTIGNMLVAADRALSRDIFTTEQRARFRAQIAFVGYKIASPHFYSLERNYRANPNMTTMRYATLGLLACMLPKHPMAKAWFDEGIKEVERELAEWIGPNGGWMECPHYQMTSVSDIFCLLSAAQRAGFSDLLYDERLLKTMLYLAKISTPPDPRLGNFRHFPPAGNTYRMETSCMFSIFAKLHQERNPEAAEALQWTWIQQGRPLWRNIGGAGGSIKHSVKFLVADFEPKGPPAWKSELFPKSGAMLRSGFPGERETQLYLLQGPFWEHYDYDRGSFSLWGKGRPLSLDWGYNSRMPAWQHNRMDVGFSGRVTEFAAQDSADYLHSVQDGWHRQILFVKDPDPVGPNYFLVRDSTSGKGKADWWLWLYTNEDPMLAEDVVRMTGQSDVDLDIWFAPPWAKKFSRKTGKEVADDIPPDLKRMDNVTLENGQQDSGSEFGPDVLEEQELTQHIKTKALAIPCHSAFLEKRNGMDRPSLQGQKTLLTQKGLHLVVPRGEPVVCVLYPRLRDEKPPTFHELAEGKGVRVESAAGTDYAFLALKPFAYDEDDVAFEGTAGAIQVRGKTVSLSLGASGKLRYRDKTLSSEKEASRQFGPQ